MINEFKNFKDDINKRLDKIDVSIKEVADNMKECYVTKERFAPIEKIVWTVSMLIIAGVVTAIIALVVRK